MTLVGIEPTTTGLDLPLLYRLSSEVGQRKYWAIKVVNRGTTFIVPSLSLRDLLPDTHPPVCNTGHRIANNIAQKLIGGL